MWGFGAILATSSCEELHRWITRSRGLFNTCPPLSSSHSLLLLSVKINVKASSTKNLIVALLAFSSFSPAQTKHEAPLGEMRRYAYLCYCLLFWVLYFVSALYLGTITKIFWSGPKLTTPCKTQNLEEGNTCVLVQITPGVDDNFPEEGSLERINPKVAYLNENSSKENSSLNFLLLNTK